MGMLSCVDESNCWVADVDESIVSVFLGDESDE